MSGYGWRSRTAFWIERFLSLSRVKGLPCPQNTLSGVAVWVLTYFSSSDLANNGPCGIERGFRDFNVKTFDFKFPTQPFNSQVDGVPDLAQ